MSTNSNIAIEIKPGIAKMIYCHWDGYPSHNGKILLNHWSDRQKLMTMIEEGDVSNIAENLGTQHDFRYCPVDECNFYRRDRKEYRPENKASDISLEHFADFALEYFYYLDLDGVWHYSDHGKPFKVLTQEICDAD